MINVLLITNKSDVTTDFIVKELKKRNINFYRFNTEELTKSLSISLDVNQESYFLLDRRTLQKINIRQFSAVYFRRPELPVQTNAFLTKAEIDFINNEILYSLEGIYKILRNAYWISPVYAIREAENKIYQLEIAQSLGFRIPNSFISNSYGETSDFYKRNKKKCIIKPLNSGLIEDGNQQRILFTNSVAEFPATAEEIETCPQFFQNLIEKEADIRVTVVGNKIFSTMIHSQDHEESKIDWRKSDFVLSHSRTQLPEVISQKCVELLSILKLRFGAIDLVLDKHGNYFFLEINPNGQWAWIEKQTGYEISAEIVNLLCNENF